MGQELGLAIVAGLGLGGMYALVAMGYTLVLASSGVFNFAQGSTVMIGVISLYWLWQLSNWPFLVAMLVIVAAGGIIGILNYVIAVRPVVVRGGTLSLTEGTLVTTLGLGLAINAGAALVFTDETRAVNSYVTESPLSFLGIPIRPIYLVMMAVTVVIAILTELLMRRSTVGLLLRATVLDREGARLVGVPVLKVVLGTFGAAGILAALVGVLMAPVTFASPFVGEQFLLLGFAAMAIGGFGSFAGAFVGGVLVGLISNIVPIFIDPNLTSTALYLVLLVVLLVRPTGLFGAAGGFGAARLREV